MREYVEHVEQLRWGLCQHCLHQMPRKGGGSTGGLRAFMMRWMGVGSCRVSVWGRERGRERELKAERQWGNLRKGKAALDGLSVGSSGRIRGLSLWKEGVGK